MAEAPAELVREQLERIVSSEMFLNSERLCRFLHFTVEAKLRGEAGQIKEYLLGREVFDRNSAYDPRADPIVRVEARRLRRKLEEYYSGPGLSDPLRIEFPKGSYTPEFTPAAKSPGRRPMPWLAAALLVAGIAAAVVYLRPNRVDANAIAVIPARWVWDANDFPATPHDVDLAERIAAELANRRAGSVIGWPALQRLRQGRPEFREYAAATGAGRTLVVSVREEPEGSRVTAFLMDTRTGQKLRVEDTQTQSIESTEARRQIASQIAASILK